MAIDTCPGAETALGAGVLAMDDGLLDKLVADGNDLLKKMNVADTHIGNMVNNFKVDGATLA